MDLPRNAHVAIIDGETFKLMQNDGEEGHPNLVMRDQPDLEATNHSAGVRHQDEAGQRLGRTQLDELAHAAAAAEWLNKACIENRIEQLVIIADPKSLGAMRHQYHTELKAALLSEIAKTLTKEPTDRIEQAIAAA